MNRTAAEGDAGGEQADVIDRRLADLVEVPGGTTPVGSTLPSLDAELTAPDPASLLRAWFLREVPRREVSLPTFQIGRVPVTVAQVEALAPQTGVRPVLVGGPDHPATLGVDASFAFCDALSGMPGLRIGRRHGIYTTGEPLAVRLVVEE